MLCRRTVFGVGVEADIKEMLEINARHREALREFCRDIDDLLEKTIASGPIRYKVCPKKQQFVTLGESFNRRQR